MNSNVIKSNRATKKMNTLRKNNDHKDMIAAADRLVAADESKMAMARKKLEALGIEHEFLNTNKILMVDVGTLDICDLLPHNDKDPMVRAHKE